MQIRIEKLLKTYNGVTVLKDVNLHLTKGRVLVLVGPSGGGKSTLLKIIAGLEVPDSGIIEIDRQPLLYDEVSLQHYRRQIGVVFQAYNLFPHLSALRNITLPLEKVQKMTPNQARERAIELLTRFGLETHAHKYPHQLSGGQQQRVAIARAVAVSSGLLLFDEPTSSLDPGFTAEVLEMIEELKAEGRDMVLVTHEMGFARKVADYLVYIDHGYIMEQGYPYEFFNKPQTDELKDFLARILRY